MKINIYYGGRGLIDDPTLYVLNHMQIVLEELNVKVERFNLHELKNEITVLPNTLKDADGIILASTVEWYGVGGYMQMFLDACWLYGDKEKITKMYMSPIVMSSTYGERDGKLNLCTAWEILGGKPCSGICGYIRDIKELEANLEYRDLIEKKAENLYRTVQQKRGSFPASNQEVSRVVGVHKNADLTPQETEQLSKYAANESYVQKQKEDIEELTNHFKAILDIKDTEERTEFVQDFVRCYKHQADINVAYHFFIENKKKPLSIKIVNGELECFYGELDQTDVDIHINAEVLNEIISGRMTFQRAFMGGNMKMKGEFKTMRMLDQVFAFQSEGNIL